VLSLEQIFLMSWAIRDRMDGLVGNLALLNGFMGEVCVFGWVFERNSLVLNR
jgi:hypothetical protein